ncbi:MAG: cytochrome P450 [Acidimicrobiales bacterium]
MTEPMTVDLSDADFWQDPYPTWQQARRQSRTARTTQGEPIVLAADDVDTLNTDPVFAQLGLDALRRLGITEGPLYEWRGLTLAANDGEVHERLRALVGRAFTPRRVERLRAGLYDRAKAILESATETGRFDVVADYAHDLPLWLLCQFLGLPLGDYTDIARFLVGTEEGFAEPMTPERRARAEGGITALYDYVEGLVDDRLARPREDLITDLVQSEREGRLDRAELLALVVNVIGGAVGSTRAGIANSVYLLLAHREQAEWVRDDHSRVRLAVEECLRYAPPFRAGRRKAVVATSRFGLELQPGDTVYLARPAVNRDPKRWSDPERFDVSRPEQRHYSFGYGPHFCLGQALARLDIQVAVQAMVERIDDLELLIERPVRVPFTTDEQIEALPVAVARR